MPVSLKVITLFNFKSFRGKIVIDNIQSFTAIIGPNGFGKSNIMDAISFVLGENLSALRVKCFNELIHGAIIGKPAIEGAYVTIVLTKHQNQEKNYTRTIQEKSSQYKIDDKIVTKDFYMTELKKFGLDIKAGNFLLPQGYIQYFTTINMPKELTAMFEEISGSNKYKTEYDRLKLELLKVNQEIHFVYQTKKDQLRQKKSTIIEKIEAEKYLQLQKQYMEKKLKFQLIQLIFMKKEIKSLQNKQKEIKLYIDEYLQSKKTEITLLKHTKLKIKPLIDSLNKIEESILELEDNIRKKKIEHIKIENHIEYWKKKRDYARTSLDSANIARNNHKKAVQELKNELEIIRKKSELKIASPEDDIIEFHNSQVNRYMILKTEAESQAKDFINCINDLMHDRQTDQYKLDNENRRKEELENKIKFETLRKEQLKMQVQKLKTSNDLFKLKLVEKKTEEQNLEKEIKETQEKSLKLENDIAKISEELAEVDINNDIVLQQKKKTEIIKNLKEFFPGVHDRLSNLCKPIHSRYNIVVTKVFGRNMDAIVVDTKHTAKKCIYFLKWHKIGVERFLPLDSIKVKPINDKLRTELQQTNCKLLYDILKLSSIEIDKAVLYVAKNTLVCETIEDAAEKALKSDGNYDYISLDGCFFHRSGIISGGLTALSVKAKQWGNILSLSVLKEQKVQLKQEFKNLPNISRMQSDFDIINKDINQLTIKNEIVEKNIKDITEEIKIHDRKLNNLRKELSLQDTAISIIQQKIQEKDEKIKTIKEDINEIKNKIFLDFCKVVNVPDITYYEKNLCTYKERLIKEMENINQRNYINNQLHFENEFNRDAEFEDKILRWKCAVEQADVEYNKAYKQEENVKIAIVQEETKMSKIKNNYKIIEKYLEDVKKELVQCRSKIGIISKSYLENQKAYMAMQSKIEQKKAKCESIFKESKLESITIPMLSETLYERDINSSNSNLSTESLNIWETMMNIDFSQISEYIHNNTTDLQNVIEQFKIKLIQIQNEIKTLKKPNLKAHKNIDLIMQEIRKINKKHYKLRIKSNNIGKQFEIVKAKRHKLFMDCVECIVAEIDSIYKNLANDTSAQAFIILENPEEPYTSGINYSCIPSSKRIQPLQYLSDGEKTIANLAFLFAILRYKATFFIMDEGDAALDNANINKLILFIRSQMNNLQIIVITLNKHLSSHADILIGVTTKPKTVCTESMIFAVPILTQH